MSFPRFEFQPPVRAAEKADPGERQAPRVVSGMILLVALAGEFLSGCRIEPLAPTTQFTQTLTPTAEQPLGLLLPTLVNVTPENSRPNRHPDADGRPSDGGGCEDFL